MTRYGYELEQIAGFIFRAEAEGASPLYRLVHDVSLDHFYTADAAERDQAVSELVYREEEPAGFVYASGQPGTVPLHRLVYSD